jgi:NADPH:quinone reductase
VKAICVTPSRELEVRDIPLPQEPQPGHILVDMDASAINHGDKAFLSRPLVGGKYLAAGRYDVWGASGSGKVIAVGEGVPVDYAGKQVAIYRSLDRSPDSIGLWCERSHVPYTACLILPDHVRARDYCGSLVNVMTAYAFLDQIAAEGHKGVIVTAGNSATGHALASLARRRSVPAIFLVRSEAARASLQQHGVEHVIVTAEEDFQSKLGALAAELEANAVFDGVGGDLLSSILPVLPMNSTIYIYGFLGATVPVSLPTALLMMKNLTIKRFSNFESETVKDQRKLMAAFRQLEAWIDDPMFATDIGKEFGFDQIDQAMAYESKPGAKAVFTWADKT